MTAYSEDTGEKLTDGSTVPAGRVLEVTRVNGTQIVRENGFPVSVAMPKGTVLVYRDGVCTYEDDGITTGHPTLGVTATNGSFTVTFGYPLFDAEGKVTAFIETSTQTWTVALTGVAADTTAPVLVSTNPASGATGIARDSEVTLTFSKPVQFGTGLVTLRNVTGAVDFETFDVATEVGTGLGQINVSGSVVRLKATTALPASSVIAVRIAATAIKDLANNAFAGIAGDTQSFTTVAGAPVSTATFYFGALTPAGQAGIPATSLVDSTGHFVLTAGRVVLSATGDAVNLTSSPYSVTLNGAEVTIEAVPNAISVSTLAQAQAAIASFQSTPTVDSTVLMRNGDDWPYDGVNYASFTTAAMNGVFSDVNSAGFVTAVTAQAYNADAVATLTGGTITVRPDTPLGATIRCRLQTHSNARIIFSGVSFESVALADSRNLTEGLPAVTGANVIDNSASTFMILAGTSVASPTGTTFFKSCRLGGKAFGTPSTRYGSYVRSSSVGRLVFEDCDFDGYFHGCNGAATRHYLIRRCSSQRKIGDFARCFGTLSATTGDVNTPVYWEFVKNTELNLVGSNTGDGGEHWGAYHSDYTQTGTGLDQVNVQMIDAYSIHYAEMDRSDPTSRIQAYYNGTLGRPNFAGVDFSTYPRRRSQGSFSNYLSSGKRRIGTIYKSAYVSNCRNGIINGGTDQMDIINSMVLHGMGNLDDQLTNSGSAQDRYRIDVSGNSTVAQPAGLSLRDSIFNRFVQGGNYTETNNALLVLTPTGAQSFAANFAGTFGTGSFGPQIAFNTTNGVAAFRADFIAKMSSRAGSLAAGKGPWA